MSIISSLRKGKQFEAGYLTCFFIFTYFGVLKTSLVVPAHLSLEFVFLVFKIVATVAFISFLARPVLTWPSKIVLILLTTVGYFLCINSQNFDFFYYLVFVIAAYAIDFKRILKVYLSGAISGTLSVMLLCLIGVVPNELFARQGLSAIRNSFGFFTPTDFAARIFFILLAYYMLRKFSLIFVENFTVLLLLCTVYYFTNARLDFLLLLFLFITGLLTPKLKKINLKMHSFSIFLVTFTYIIGSILISLFYRPANKVLNYLNTLLSGRVEIGAKAIRQKGITLLGQHVHEQGNGRAPKGNFQYFYIDSSYIRLLVISGILIFLLVVAAIFILQKKLISEGLFFYSFGLFLVILSSAVDQHLVDLSYNMLFLGLLARTSDRKQYTQ